MSDLLGSAIILRLPKARGPNSVLPWNHPMIAPSDICLAVILQSSFTSDISVIDFPDSFIFSTYVSKTSEIWFLSYEGPQ